MKGIALAFLLGAAWPALAQDSKTPYPSMAPMDQYLMENRNSEIALARSAAQESVSKRCRGNGFRASRVPDRGAGEERFRVPGGTFLDRAHRRSELLESETPSSDLLQCGGRAFLPSADVQEDGLDPRGRLEGSDGGRDRGRHRQEGVSAHGARGHVLHAVQAGILERSRRALASPPHVFFSDTDPAVWGANLPGSPVLAFHDTWERLTTFLVPVRQWSDGTVDH